MKWHVIVLIVFGFALTGIAQTGMESNLGTSSCYEEGYGAVKINGGYIISAAQNCQGTPTAWQSWLIKLTNDGDTIWTRLNEPFNGFLKKPMSNRLLFIGREMASLNTDTTIIQLTDTNGAVKWKNTISLGACNTSAYDAIRLSSGDYLVCGFYSETGCSSQSYNAFARKINSNGITDWTIKYDLLGDEQFYRVEEMANGNLAFFGWTDGEGAGLGDALLLLTDSAGIEINHYTYGSADNERGYGMSLLPDGFVFVYHNDSTRVVKTDFTGAIIWEKTTGDACGSAYFKTISTKDNRIGILANEAVNGNCNSTLTMLDSSGNLIWRKNWDALFREVKEIKAGSFLLTGYSGFPSDVHIARIDTIFGDTTTTTSIEVPINSQHEIRVYPNPSTGNFNISTDKYTPINIYNNLGQLILSGKTDELGLLIVSLKEKGIFFIVNTSEKGITKTNKLVILN